jgi:hypothetical protein
MLAAIQGDQDTVAADPSQSPVLHGAGTEGTGQSRSFCPDAAHIREVHTTRHRWVTQTRMGGQTRGMCSDWGMGEVPYFCPPSLRPFSMALSDSGSFPGRQAALPTACLSMTCLPSRARGFPGAGAGGHRSITTCVVGNTDRHQRMPGGAQEPGVCDSSRGDPRCWPAGEQSGCLVWGWRLGWAVRAKHASCSHSSLTLLPDASLNSWMHTPWRIRV